MVRFLHGRADVNLPILWIAAALVLAPLAAGAAERNVPVYRWTDEKGVVHYGDAVPPQYADQEQTVLNRQGLAVAQIPGRRSSEQEAQDAAAKAADSATRAAQQQRQLRDQNLLATYLSSAEIEALRDRRLEILEGQVRAISQYVDQLRHQSGVLEQQMRHFKPYARAGNAPAVPEPLAEEVVRNVSDLQSQTRSLRAKREEIDRTRTQFADDLQRFQELKSAGRVGAKAH
jgi:hypothetical protein